MDGAPAGLSVDPGPVPPGWFRSCCAGGLGEGILQGPFKKMVLRHKRRLKMSCTPRAEPRGACLADELFGAWPTSTAGMADADLEANSKSFMAKFPAQIMVAGSVSAVARPLKPFVPEGSQYHHMAVRWQEEQALLMENRRQNPSC